MATVRIGSYCKSIINYHIIWIPKYRTKLFYGKVKIVFEQINRGQCEDIEADVLASEFMPDHIYTQKQEGKYASEHSVFGNSEQKKRKSYTHKNVKNIFSAKNSEKFYANKIGGILMNAAIKMLYSFLIGGVAMGIAKLVHPSWNITQLLIFGLMVFAVTFVLTLLVKRKQRKE